MSELGRPFLHPDLRRLIDADRNAPAPPDSIKRQVGEQLDRSLGLGGAILAAAPGLGLAPPPPRDSGVPPLPPPPASIFGWKVVAGATLAAVIGGAALFSFAGRGAAPVQTSRGADRLALAVEKAPLETSGGAALGDPAPLRAPDPAAKPVAAHGAAETGGAARPARRHRATPRASVTPIDTLAAERTVLDGARAALVRRDAPGALAALRSHEQTFPRGQLLEERESMRVQALSLAHDLAAAHASGESFRRRFPRSMFLPAVEQALVAAP